MRKQVNGKKGIATGRYYGTYSIVFIVAAFLIFLPFILNGRSLVFIDQGGGGDGLVQHYNAFVYYGKYLRGIVQGLMSGQGLEIPMFDLSIGYGQDIINTLSYYVIGDPFSFLSAFIPVRFSELGFSLLIVFRMYFAGIAFSAYARYRGQDSFYTMIGAIIYVFSSYGVIFGTLHPYFVNPMIYMPLIAMGVDKVLTEKKPLQFILSVAIAGISNFYFFYMIVILTIIYAVFRTLELKKDILRTSFTLFGYGVLASLMAAVILIPSLIGILDSSRIGGGVPVPLFYDPKYYFDFPGFFLAASSFRNYPSMGYTVISLIAVMILILKGRERTDRFVLAGLGLMIIFIAFPFFGHAFNGFSYVTNRWIWAFSFLIAYILSSYLPKLGILSKRDWTIILVIILVFASVSPLFDSRFRTSERALPLILAGIIGLVCFLIFFRGKISRTAPYLLMSFAVVSLVVSVFLEYMPLGRNRLSNYPDYNSAYSRLTKNSPGGVLDGVDSSEFYRYDAVHFNNENVIRNSAMQLKKYSTSFYFSSAEKSVSDFFVDTYLNFPMEQSFANLDSRSILESLMSVKYGITFKEDSKYAPYGFNSETTENEKFKLLQSDYYLPLGFTSEKYMEKSEYDKLNVVERQQALMQAIVVEGDIVGLDRLSSGDLELRDVSLDWDYENADGVTVEEGANGEVLFRTDKSEASLDIIFPEVSGGELYLIYENLNFVSSSTSSDASTQARIRTVGEDDKSSWTVIRNEEDNYYSGRHNFLSNLHYTKGPRSRFRMFFSDPGDYSVDNLKLVHQPLDWMGEKVEYFSEYHLNNVSIGVNEVSGDINLPEARLMLISIPYSGGWTAYVDGEESEILKGDVGFMALKLEAGSHEIVLKYKTPYLIFSGILSIISTLCLIIWYNIWVRKSKKRRAKR